MVQLTPCVIKSSVFGEVTALFLNGNDLYVTRMEGIKRDVKRIYVINLTNLKAFHEVDSLPPVPVKPEPTVKLAMCVHFFWKLREPTDRQFNIHVDGRYWRYKDQYDISDYEFASLLAHRIITPKDSTMQEAQEFYEQERIRQEAEINETFEPMEKLDPEISRLVAALYTYRGDGKKVTQGLKALGLEAKLEQNFVTEGLLGIKSLEDLVVGSTEPSE